MIAERRAEPGSATRPEPGRLAAPVVARAPDGAGGVASPRIAEVSADAVVALRSVLGNRATVGLLASRPEAPGPQKPVIRRQPTAVMLTNLNRARDDEAIKSRAHLANLLEQLRGWTESYLALDVAERDGDDGFAMLLGMREAAADAEDTLTRLREQMGEASPDTPLGRARAAANALRVAAGNRHKTLDLARKGAAYDKEVEPATLAALQSRQARYMTIAPRPGKREAEATSGSGYPSNLPTDEAFTLALPPNERSQGPFTRVDVQFQGSGPLVLDVLTVAGNHGGVGALFEQSESPRNFEASYWQDHVVKPLVQRGVKAKMVVLDACLTASMVSVFKPLVAPGGRMICSMYSINASLMTPTVWQSVIDETKAPAGRATEVVQDAGRAMSGRPREFTAEGLINTIQSGSPGDIKQILAREPQAAAIASQLRYLPRMLKALEDWGTSQTADRDSRYTDDLLRIAGGDPAPEDAEAELAARLASLIGYGQGREASDLLRDRYRELLAQPDAELQALAGLLRPTLSQQLQQGPSTQAPTHVSVYDETTNTLRYDKLYDDDAPNRRIQYSTGSQSASEVRQLRQALQRIAQTGIKVAPLSASTLFA